MYDGFVNVLKPPGMTSHDVVGFCRRLYGQKRIGHGGTLDPGAAGVLPVALGQATRLIEYMADAGKGYRAELTFGVSTDSGDEFGKVTACEPFTMPARETVEAVLQGFLGEITQVPPMQSAIKVNGKKLYELARQGVVVDVPPRVVRIDRIALCAYKEQSLLFDVDCSKGTYIRTLCMDIGAKLNIPALMRFLIRTRVGDFLLERAKTLEEIQRDPQGALLPADIVLARLPKIICSEIQAAAFCHGQTIALQKADVHSGETVGVYSGSDFLGIGKVAENSAALIPAKVMSR